MSERGPLAVLATYESRSRPGLEYRVLVGSDERIYCDCPAWRFQGASPKERKDCKHLRDWRQKNGQG